MSKIELECEECGKVFLREKKEHNRNTKLGRKVYCSLSCSGKNNHSHLEKGFDDSALQKARKVTLNRIKSDSAYRFKYYIKTIKRRKRKCGNKTDEITKEYLLELWNKQGGICPFTGWKLRLPKSCQGFEISDMKCASLDRIDSSKPYIRDNVRFTSRIANFCKNEWSDEEVYEFCKAVTESR